ncbi:response regulator [Geomonas sp. RF6]|uniref:response regulator n=1 Tax=Geomonas sp. RF6 TaxID=2897342 RepID=UPI001E4DE959|nr:response regulator [Geomonas sp. RF6]UFS70766.1 response regulator [Geomonas sp. RF6]
MRILIVDDIAVNRMVLDTMLSVYGETVLVENGAEGVWAVEEALAAEDPFDLICLDINMPEMDGLEALHAIRAAEQRHDVKRAVIVMVTASSRPEDMLRSLEQEGCDAFVVKPVLWQTLRSVIGRHGLLEEADDAVAAVG